MSLSYKDVDLLLSDAQFLAHQCNCSTRVARGLAAALFAAHPYADTYACRGERRPGTIDVFWPAEGRGVPGVINCNAQRGPGRPRGRADSAEQRLIWFQECLAQISRLEGLQSVAFPHNVGCGLAGGDWGAYERLLVSFAESMPAVDVVVCRLPEPPSSRKRPRGAASSHARAE